VTERTLVLILLVSAMLSAVVMWVVQSNVSGTRANMNFEAPGALNFLMQSDHNLDRFIDSVRTLQLAGPDNPDHSEQMQSARERFDVVWSSLSIFYIQFPIELTTQDRAQQFIDTAQAFLTDHEPWMAVDAEWSDAQMQQLVLRAQEVSDGIRSVGENYFIQATVLTDNSQQQLDALNGYMRLFIGLLVITSGLVIGLLVRANVRTNALWEEAKNARTELAATVDELRSGRREQRAKDSFIAAASHDLRQPLHALGLFLNSLRYEIKPGGEQALTEAIQCTDALNRLFNSMLDLSRLDAGVVSVAPEHFNLQQLLQSLHSELNASASDNGMTLSFNGPTAYAHTDPILLGRVIRNLVDNAIAHSEATELVLDSRPVRNGHEIVIADNGRGIPASEQKSIFSEYYQIGNPERDRSKGLGLGLSIVRRLSDLLDIGLQLDSEIGRGTRFTMQVPGGEAQAPVNAIATSSAPHMHEDEKPVIVVIDDDFSILTAMRISLVQMGMRPICADTTDGALEQLANEALEPDLIVADYRLRDHQTGDQAILSLREAIDQPVPGIIITGDTSPQRVSQVTSTEFEVMHKPVDAETLHTKIHQLLRNVVANESA